MKTRKRNICKGRLRSANRPPHTKQSHLMDEIIMSALLTLTPHQFSDLTDSLWSDFRLQNHRGYSLLLSPSCFAHTLHFLNSLSIHQKTMLIAGYLLRTLKQLTLHWDWDTHTHTHTPTSSFTRLRDFDAALLLLMLCEVTHYNPGALESCPSSSKWIHVVREYTLNNMFTLTLSGGLGVSGGTILSKYIDIATRCWRFVDASRPSGCGGMMGTSSEVVVSLPSVEMVVGIRVECAICKEEMSVGRDVCQLGCGHMFHWSCVLPWLNKSNTCPYCRFQLPTDDIFGEIHRLWHILLNKATCRKRTTSATLLV